MISPEKEAELWKHLEKEISVSKLAVLATSNFYKIQKWLEDQVQAGNVIKTNKGSHEYFKKKGGGKGGKDKKKSNKDKEQLKEES